MSTVGGAYYDTKRYRDALRTYKEVRGFKWAPVDARIEAAYYLGL